MSMNGADASEPSTAISPVRREKIQPPQVSDAAERASRSGSCSPSQVRIAFGRPAKCSEPLTRNASSSTPDAAQRSTAAAARPSFHRIAGPVGAPSPSTSQLPSPCAVSASRSAPVPVRARTSRTASATARQTSAMSCSARPGAGLVTAVGRRATASSVPSSAYPTALIIVVPASTQTTVIGSPVRCVVIPSCGQARPCVARDLRATESSATASSRTAPVTMKR
ncbi:hypothetical protein LUX39_06395 [Actinomadura madurae]|nr:hypothetical protein [Actinomadura madurae]MCP9964795.1 hypothetical protein [Actinomadura madurae]MCQ0013467.1 hypothetical protein [Actinomadura madurae]